MLLIRSSGRGFFSGIEREEECPKVGERETELGTKRAEV